MSRIAIYLLFMCAGLTACTPTLHQLNNPSQSIRSPAQVTRWQVQGAIAVKNQQKGWTSALQWHQNGQTEYLIHLYGPLGSNALMIEQKGHVIRLHDGPQEYSANNAEELLYRQAGVRVPVYNLFYWIRGIVAPGKVQIKARDEGRRILAMEQAGYHIEYTAYQDVQGIALPSKIKITGHGMMLKMVLKQWDVT